MSSIKSIAEHKLSQFFRQLPQETTSGTPAHQMQFAYLFVLNKLLNTPHRLDPERQHAWLTQIRGNQQADGHFLQSATTADFCQLSFSALSVAALSVADLDIRFPLYASRIFRDQTFTENWFQQSENILITPECSIQKALRTGKTFLYTSALLNKSISDGFLEDAVISHFFDCSDGRANPETGFWVRNEPQPSIQGLVDGWARVQAYFFFNRMLPYPEKMLQSLLHLQKRNGHFHTEEKYFLLVDLAALTILAELSQQVDSFQFRVQRALKRVIKALNRLVPMKDNSIPEFPGDWFGESFEFDETGKNLHQIVLFSYWAIFQQLTEIIFGKRKNGFKLRTLSPCFTFQP